MFLFPACLRVVRLKAIDHHFLIQKVVLKAFIGQLMALLANAWPD